MKKSWFLKILKTFGISFASIIGAVVLTGGVMYLVGALNPKKVELTSMSFEKQAYVLDGVTISENGEVAISNYDSTVKLIPGNEDATELDVSLSNNGNSVAKIISFDSQNVAVETNTNKVGSNIIFDLTNSIGGTFDLKADQDFLTASTKIFVDLKLNSFNLTSSINENNIYPGTNFTISLSNCSPSTYLRKPNSSFYSVYGENYFNKNPLYFSSNENIATVNQKTGEITVLDEGEFTIFVYVPKTYKLNANLPEREDFLDAESYFNTLANYCVLQQKTFNSKSIEIGSISSSTEIHNLNVFTTYKYSYNDLYQANENQLNLNIKIHVPNGTSFDDKDLDYKAKELEIYEGVFDSETSSYSILPFIIDEVTGERVSEHFKILKTYQKYPYWQITPIDYYSGAQNYCLIAVIDDNKEGEKIINGNSLIQITETNKFHFSAVKVVNNYTPSTLSLEKVEYLLNLETVDVIANEGVVLTNEDGTVFDLNELSFAVSPNNASYKKIAFFIDASTPDGVLASENSTELKPETEGDYLNKILIRAKSTGVAYINAVIVKTKNSEFGETYYTNIENSQVVEMSQRIKIKLVITSKINFENFAVNTQDFTSEGQEITGFKITKGKSVSLSFNSSSELLTVYNQGLFKIYTSAKINEDTEKIALDVKTLGTQSEISITGTETGETILYLELNDVIVKQFNIQVVSDAIKTLTLSENELNINLDYEQSTPSKNVWEFNNGEGLESFDVLVSADENKEIKNLKYYCSVDSKILEVKVSSDFKKLTLTPKMQYDGIITLSVSTENSDNQTIYSTNTIQISINVPEIVFEHNSYNNTITIAGKEYEQVISGEEYDILKKDDAIKYIYDAKIEGTNTSVERLFTIPSVENSYEGKKFNADEVSQLELVIKTSFGLEKTINILILPKYQLTTSTLSLTSAELNSPIDLDNYDVVELDEYSYNSNNKIQKVQSQLPLALTYESMVNTLGSLSGSVYTKPEVVFENIYDKVLVKTIVDGKTLKSSLNIQLYANASLQSSQKAKELFAGETVEINSLLELSVPNYKLKVTKVNNLPNNISYNASTNELIISSSFKDLTANILIAIDVFNVENEKVYSFENFALELQISYYELFLNENYLTEAYSRCDSSTVGALLVVENDAQLQVNEIHKEDVGNFEVGEYVVKVKKLYLFATDFELNNLILSATKTSINGVEDAKSSVEFFDGLDNKINNISNSSTIYAKVVINGTTILSKEIFVEKVTSNIISKNKETLYSSITYAVSDLIKIEGNLNNYSSQILQSANVVECLNNLSEPLISGFTINNNLLKIDDYSESQIKVKMEILGQEIIFDYNYSNLIDLDTTNVIELYSNTEKELFTKVREITYAVQLLNSDNSLLTNEYISLVENNNKQILKIGALNSEILFKVKVQVSANGYQGGEYYFNIKAMPLTITQNTTELISGYEYNLSDIISISAEMLDKIEFNKENDDFDFTLTTDGKITLTCPTSTTITLKIEVADSESSSKLLLKKLTFNLLKISIEKSSVVTGVYEGQVIDSATLLSFINLKTDSGHYVNNFKNLITIQEINSEGKITIPVGENDYSVNYSLGTDITKEIILSVSKVIFTNGEGYKNGTYTTPTNFNVYSGTKLSNYIQAGYLLDTNFIALNSKMRFKLVENETNSNFIKSLDSNFETTGALTLKAKPEVEGSFQIEVTLVGVENISQTITFNVKVAKANQSENSVKLGVGDFEIKISDTAYFGTETQKINATYELENFNLVGTSASRYIIAKTNGKYVLLKDSVVVVSVENDILNLTSALDSMKITIVGYLNPNISGITLTSTKEEKVTFVIELTKINVSMQTASNFDVAKRTVNATEYYQIAIEGTNNIPLSNVTNPSNSDILVAVNPNDSSFNRFTNIKIANAFVCDKDGQTLFEKDDGSGFEFNDSVITLPMLKNYNSTLVNQTISLVKSANWNLVFDNQNLSNYIHITLEYVVNTVQTGTINIILAPNKYLNFIGSTTEAKVFTYNTEEPTKYLTSALIFVPDIAATYSHYDLVATNNLDDLTDFSIYCSYVQGDVVSIKQSDKYSCEYNETDKKIVIKEDEISTTNIENDQNGNKINYYICIEFNSTKYYYHLSLQEVKILTQIVENNGELQTSTLINSTNPLKIKNVLQEGKNTLDLKNYIFIKTSTNDNICINSEQKLSKLLLNKLSFDQVDLDNYSISEEGVLTIKDSINEKIEITFKVCGASYSIFIQGEIIKINFVGKTNLSANSSYYIYSTEDSTGENLIITTTQSENAPTVVCKDYLSFDKFCYTFGGNKVTEQSLFDVDTSTQNVIIVSYVGETLAKFTKINNYYKVSNLLGGFSFDVVTQYKESTNRTTLNVSSVVITPNYVSPSVVNGIQYQNVLSNSTTNLNNLINCEGSAESLSYSLLEYNSGISINGSNLIVSKNVFEEKFLTIKVLSGEIYEYYNIRVIPQYKVTLYNNNTIFNVLKGDVISLLDFMKVESFTAMDSTNNPIYVQNLNCYYFNSSQISSPLSYQISHENSFEILVKVVSDGEEMINETLTFNLREISTTSFNDLSCFIGESLNVKNLVSKEIDKLNITLTPNYTFSNENNDISKDGIFQTLTANSNTKVEVMINSIKLNLTIDVKDFVLEPKYPSNAYYLENNEITTKYINVYATQNLKLSDYIYCPSFDDSKLSFEVVSSSFSVYSLDGIANKVIYKSNGIKIFEINNSNQTITVFKELNNMSLTNNELLIGLNCVVDENTCKNCQIYLRLMKVELSLTKTNDIEPTNISSPFTIKSESLIKVNSDYYFDLKNVASAKTICANNNIYLSNNLKFSVIEGEGTIFDNSYIKFNNLQNNETYNIQVQVTLGESGNQIQKLAYLTLNFKENLVSITSEINEGKLKNNEFSDFKFKNTQFIKSSEDKTILSKGEISAIYSSNYLVTLTVPKNETFNAYVISQNGEDIMWITLTGTFKILINNYHDIKLNVEAKKGDLIITSELSFVNSETSNSFAQPLIDVDSDYEFENGIKYYILHSGETNSAFIDYDVVENNSVVNFQSGSMLANVSELTYAQMKVKKGENGQTLLLNIKVYPTIINKLYTEDFTMLSDVEINGNSAVQKGRKYNVLYVFNNLNTFNLDDYFSITSNNKTFNATYELFGATYLDVDTGTFVVDNSICTLDANNVLTIEKTETVSYVGITVKNELNETYILAYFKFMPLSFENLTSGECQNYSEIELNKLCKVVARSENALISSTLTNAVNEDITNYLTFNLTKATFSKIENNKLVVFEVGNNAEIELQVSYNNVELGTITLQVSNPSGNYLINNIYYEEIFDNSYSQENKTLRQYTITNFSGYEIEKIVINDIDYAEKVIDDSGVITITTQNGNVKIYPNGNVESTENNIIYVFLKNNNNNNRYIKLNNYNIVKDVTDGSYKYYLNGEEKIGLLRFEFVNSKGLMIENSVITDETISVNNLTLNRFTGEISGTQNNSEEMFIKIYISEDIYNTSEKFIVKLLNEF